MPLLREPETAIDFPGGIQRLKYEDKLPTLRFVLTAFLNYQQYVGDIFSDLF